MTMLCYIHQAQQTNTCQMSTIETLEQDVKRAKLSIKTSERRYWHRSVFFIVNFEHILYIILVYILLNLII